eukprot:10439971-Alexandrium_andersonii.AAC.1
MLPEGPNERLRCSDKGRARGARVPGEAWRCVLALSRRLGISGALAVRTSASRHGEHKQTRCEHTDHKSGLSRASIAKDCA